MTSAYAYCSSAAASDFVCSGALRGDRFQISLFDLVAIKYHGQVQEVPDLFIQIKWYAYCFIWAGCFLKNWCSFDLIYHCYGSSHS